MSDKALEKNIKNYDLSEWLKEKAEAVLNHWLAIDFEITENSNEITIDSIAYEIELLENVKTIEDFHNYIKENKVDKGNYEVDRFTFLSIKKKEKHTDKKGD